MELAGMLRRGEVSAREITQSVFKRIDEKEKSINAFVTTTRETAFKQADLADEKFRKGGDIPLLTGIPVAVKDLLCTKGIKTTCGSRILEDFVPTYNATACGKILDAGAVLVGKTNMDEFGMGSSTENSIVGPTRNPHDLERVAGGSSGGSAAAVSSGESILALGTDTGGSIRQPSRLLWRNRHQTHLRQGFPLRPDRLCLIPGSNRGHWKNSCGLCHDAECHLRP